MVPEGIDLSIIDREWANLLRYEFDENFASIKDPRKFWKILQKFDNQKGELLFTNISKVAYHALSFPNSNAPPERIWSRYNFLRNKWRASFKCCNVKLVIQVHEFVKSVGGAMNFDVNVQMYDLFNKNMYVDENEDTESERDDLLEREEYNLNLDYLKECKAFDKLYKDKERGDTQVMKVMKNNSRMTVFEFP